MNGKACSALYRDIADQTVKVVEILKEGKAFVEAGVKVPRAELPNALKERAEDQLLMSRAESERPVYRS